MRHESMEAHSIWQWKDEEKWDSSLKRVGSYGGLFQNERPEHLKMRKGSQEKGNQFKMLRRKEFM